MTDTARQAWTDWLKERMRLAGLESPGALADSLNEHGNIHRSAVYQWLSGDTLPDGANLLLLAVHVFEVGPQDELEMYRLHAAASAERAAERARRRMSRESGEAA